MSPSEFLSQFAHPDPRFSPAPIWWWSGEPLQIGRMRWQMDQLLAMGIRNVVILNLAPSGPLYGCDADDPRFLTDAWWHIFEQVCDHARDIGMSIWFYDQIGFSGANYQAELVATHPEFAAEQIRIVSTEGTGSLRIECPGAGTPLRAYLASNDGSAQPVPLEGSEARVQVASPAKLCLVYTVKQGYDYFSPDACQKLLDTVHRQFEKRLPQHLGTTIVGSFQDELPDLPTWGRDFTQSFGPVVHHLFEPGGADAQRTRLLYHQHRANLAEEALFKPFFRWHQEHGIQCGFDQQSPAREARAIGCVQKYADYIQTHRWYAAPGCDLHGNGKLHASIAYMYDRPRVWIEGFHSTGWGGTIADTFDWLLPFLQSGANLYNPHAVYYSTRMGWWEWAPPSTCWRQPYARHYRGFADMICRLTKLLSTGVQQADVAILFPTATVQSALTPAGPLPDAKAADDTLHKLIGSMKWHERALGVMDRAGISFHLLDEQSIVEGTIENGAVVLRGVPIRAIVLPNVTTLKDGTSQRLRQLASAGVKIISVGASAIAREAGATLADSPEEVPDALKEVQSAIRAPVPTLYRRLEDLHILFVPAVAGMTTQVKWRDWFANLDAATHDPDQYLRDAEIDLPPGTRKVWRFDPIGARAQPLAVSQDNVLKLDFAGAPFALLVWSESDQAEPSTEPSRAAPKRELQLSTTWTCEYVPTLPTEYPDMHDPRRPELTLPHTVELRCSRSGSFDDSSELVRAGFGTHGWLHRPGESTPRPLTYSPTFGVAQDPIHLHRLGPKGHVPEEFIDAGRLEAGQTAVVRTSVESDEEMEVVLAIGANARKSASVNGAAEMTAPPDSGAYLWMNLARLRRGSNSIDLRLTAQRAGNVRAFWCVLRAGSEQRFIRPERIVPDGEPLAGARVAYRRALDLSAPLESGKVQVAAAALVAVYFDGQLLGRQGGFDPYWVHMRGQAYDLPAAATALLRGATRHELRIELIEPKDGAPLLVDLRATDVNGAMTSLISDSTWEASRNGAPFAPVRLHSHPDGDAATWHLYRRPHALPRAAWIEGEQPGDVVLDLPLAPPANEPQEQWFHWIVPPGVTSMQLALLDAENAHLSIDDRPVSITADGSVSIGSSISAARRAVLRVRSRQLGGGVFADPIFYRFGQGELKSGTWLAQGLRSYSGGLRMRQSFRFDGRVPGSAILDLGRVRGTVEALLNRKRLGERFIAPFSFDIRDALREGENELELLVTNTLGTFLSTWSPTRGWSPDQFEAGVMGPVTVRWDG
jgi:hypothetical protein